MTIVRLPRLGLILLVFPLIGILKTFFTFPKAIDIASYAEKKRFVSKWERLQFAAFGTSDTYGSGISLEEDRERFAYPFILSSHAKNFAIRASSPNYPRACAQSIIENDVQANPGTTLDVIILEYFVRGHTGTIPLVERLRTRYPDALIIILREWNPLMHVYVESPIHEGSSVNVCTWAKNKGMNIFDKDKMKKVIKNEYNRKDIKWTWQQIIDQDKILIQEEAARLYGAHILPMERPEDPREWIDYVDLFASDCHHKSIKGHAEVANRIGQFVDEVGIVQNPRLGEWSYQDQCITWFESGNTRGIEYSSDVKLEKFANRNGPKYALSFGGKTGEVKVRNPSDIPMDLYLAYMSTGPGRSKYPSTKVRILEASNPPTENEPEKEIILDVQTSPDWNNAEVHVQKMQGVGTIPPGDVILLFESIDDSIWPFRLVSIVITQKVQNTNIQVKDERSELTYLPGHAVNLV